MVLEWPFLVVAILSALGLCGVTLIRPTQASLLPQLVTTPAELTAANAIVSFVTGSSILAGPALAALVMAVSGPSATLIVAGALLAVGALTIAFVHRAQPRVPDPRSPRTCWKASARSRGSPVPRSSCSCSGCRRSRGARGRADRGARDR
jgi:MFS family permease